MRRLLVYFLVAAIVAVIACGRGGGRDDVSVPALLEAERLLSPEVDAADSALRVLRAVDTAALTTDGDRALYALLHTQALYKTTDDPLDTVPILRAVDHYATTRPGSDRHVRALTYAGAAAESNSALAQALRYYKSAELLCDTTNHYACGYLDMKIAGIYHHNTINHPKTVSYYRKALSHFSHLENVPYRLYCTADLGGIYRMTQHLDSALNYLTIAYKDAIASGDDYLIAAVENYLVGYYYRVGDYAESLRYVHQVESRKVSMVDFPLVPLFASIAHAKSHRPDSAVFYLERSHLKSAADSAAHYEALSYIASERGDSINARLYMAEADRVNDNHIIYQTLADVSRGEQQAIALFHEYDKKNVLFHQATVYVFIGILVLSLVLLYLIIHRRKSARRLNYLKEQLSQLEEEYETLSNQLSLAKAEASQTVADIDRLCLSLRLQYNLLRDSINLSITNGGKKSDSDSILDYHINTANMANDEFWLTVENVANSLYPGLTENIKATIPDITDGDYRFLLLKAMKFPDLLVCLYTGLSNVRSAGNKLRRLKKTLCEGLSFEQWLSRMSAATLKN